MRKIIFLSVSLAAVLACSIPGISVAELTPLPTFDADAPATIIAQTAAAAQTQTALKLPTSTNTPRPTHTPSATPTFTPTFLWRLPTFTPIPTMTLPVTETQADSGGEDSEGEDAEKKNKDEDPRKFTGKQWSCVVVGTYPPRQTVFKTKVKFVVQWTIFNAGTSSWGYNDVDIVYKSGYRHEETKIQDMPRTVPSGGEIKVTATFITPKLPGEYQTFFHLVVGKRDFCGMIYTFTVID